MNEARDVPVPTSNLTRKDIACRRVNIRAAPDGMQSHASPRILASLPPTDQRILYKHQLYHPTRSKAFHG